jgi:hypothetical protein
METALKIINSVIVGAFAGMICLFVAAAIFGHSDDKRPPADPRCADPLTGPACQP